jgi:hypothetical protein
MTLGSDQQNGTGISLSPVPNTDQEAASTSHGHYQDLIGLFRSKTCPSCKNVFSSRPELEMHILELHPTFYNSLQVGGNDNDDGNPIIPIKLDLETHGKDCVTRFAADLTNVECDDISQLFSSCQGELVRVLEAQLQKRKNYKCFFQIDVQFTKYVNGVPENITRGFTSFAHTILNKIMIPRTLLLALEKIESQIESFTSERSGWRVQKIAKFQFVLSTYSPLGGGTYIPLPHPLDEKRDCLLNIDNSATPDGDQDKCFLYSVLAHENICGIPASNRNKNKIDKLVRTYKNNEKSSRLNTDGLEWPFTIDQMNKFEKLNHDISVTILAYEIDEDGDENDDDVGRRKRQPAKNRKRKSGITDYAEKCKRYAKLIKNTHLLYNTGVCK